VRVQPINFVWRTVDLVDADGVATRTMAMVPEPRYDNIAKRQFEDGEAYPLQQIEERSMRSHNQFFAAMGEYYDNLPENIAARWPTDVHFRKWCLIETNWFTEKEYEMASEKGAMMLADDIRIDDEYARIVVRGTKVFVRRAMSQSLAAMGREKFEASKKDCLELAEAMVGTPVRTMLREAGKHG